MDIQVLKVFCDVVLHRGFSRAARANRLTQSAVSQMVKRLEERLGVHLLNRDRPPSLTEEGQRFFDGCKPLVDQYFELEASIKQSPDTLTGTVRVAAIYSVGLGDMGKYVEDFQLKHLGARIHVEYLHPDKVYEKVLDGTADFGLVSFPRLSRELLAHPWRDEEMVLACAPRHPLAGRLLVRPAELEGEKYIGFDRALIIRKEVDRFLRDQGVTVEVTLEFDNIDSIKKAVEIGAGVALLPAPTLRREVEAKTLVALSLYGCQLVRPLGIIQRRHHALNATAQRFLDLLRRPEADTAAASAADAGNASSRRRGSNSHRGRNGAPKVKLKKTK
jgi:DNA-binding transcriptional LysR family regulator